MKLPEMSYSAERVSLVTDRFGGLNRTEGVAEHEFCDMKNMSADKYPAITVRGARQSYNSMSPVSAICSAGGLAFVSGGRLYYEGRRISSLSLTSGKKSLVGAGTRIYVFPDKKWYDVESSASGSMERSNTVSAGIVYFTPALRELPDAPIYQSDSPPQIDHPADFEGCFWLDSASVPAKLKRYVYNGTEGSFVEVTPNCVRLVVGDVGGGSLNSALEGFETGDGITLSGDGLMGELLASNGLDKTFVVLANGYSRDGFRYVILDTTISSQRGQLMTGEDTLGSFTLSRSVPNLDGAFFCSNRIWGYSNSENKIYCSRKNNFNAWYGSSFSLDDPKSFDASSPGDFTACAPLGEHPCFFKEGYLHKLVGSSQSITRCRGIRAEDAGSLCVLGDRLYFKSGSDVLSYNGNSFSKVSQVLGALAGDCVGAAVIGERYYMSIEGAKEGTLLVYNAQRGLWHAEDDLAFTCSAEHGGKLYVASPEGIIILADGERSAGASQDTEWFAESGDFKVRNGERKALSRLVIRCRTEGKAFVNVYVMYDGDGNYVFVGRAEQGMNCIPILPRRCDRLRLRLEGRGDFTLTSLVRTYTKASCL